MRRGTASAGGPPTAIAAAIGAAAALLAALALLPGAAHAQAFPAPVGPWDGTNPFNCLNQDVGQGTDFPEPEADPFCVEFDKTAQNVTDFGIADFLAKEPARVAAAATKCFYFQRDHWTGSIVQGSDPELWHWDGSYFFDRAKGIGGAHLTNFRLGGIPMDATPYVPAAYQPYVEPTGGGGALVLLETDPDPICGALVDTPEERADVYGAEPRYRRCAEPGGRIGRRRVGVVRLGMDAATVRERLGAPRARHGATLRWCLTGGYALQVTFAEGKRGSAPRAAALIRTTARGQSSRGIGPGSNRAAAVRKLGLRRLLRIGRIEVLAAEPAKRRMLLAGIRERRVRWIALADPSRLRQPAQLRRALRNRG
jgi:hypothetical protein